MAAGPLSRAPALREADRTALELLLLLLRNLLAIKELQAPASGAGSAGAGAARGLQVGMSCNLCLQLACTISGLRQEW